MRVARGVLWGVLARPPLTPRRCPYTTTATAAATAPPTRKRRRSMPALSLGPPLPQPLATTAPPARHVASRVARRRFQSLDHLPGCSGCGAALQTRDSHLPGFLPARSVELFLEALSRYSDLAGATDAAPELLPTVLSGGIDDGSALLDDAEAAVHASPPPAQRPPLPTCKRCHELMHYSTTGLAAPHIELAELVLSLPPPPDCLVVYVVDALDCSLPDGFWVHMKGRRVLLVVNKIDLILGPTKAGQVDRIRGWLYNLVDPKRQAMSVHAVSAKTGFGVDRLLWSIASICGDRNISAYVLGGTNAGKSALLNRALAPSQVERVTTSMLPGTTMSAIPMQLFAKKRGKTSLLVWPGANTGHVAYDHEVDVYDTPGIYNPQQLLGCLTPAEVREVCPTKSVRPVKYRLGPGDSLLIGGLARVDYLRGVSCGYNLGMHVTLFVAPHLARKIMRTRVDRADAVYTRHLGSILTPPYERDDDDKQEPFPALQGHDLEVTGEGHKNFCGDLVLSSVGFLSVSTAQDLKATLRVYLPEGRTPHRRRSLGLAHHHVKQLTKR